MKTGDWCAVAGIGAMLFCLSMAACAPKQAEAQSPKNHTQIADLPYNVRVYRVTDNTFSDHGPRPTCYVVHDTNYGSVDIDCP